MFKRILLFLNFLFFIVSFVPMAVYAIEAPMARMAIIGDAGEKSANLENLKKSIQKEMVSSLILPGDNLYSGTYATVWDNWKSAGFKFDVVAIGNHTESYDKEVQYFSMPSEYYSVIKYGARFIVLNSDNVNVNAVDKQISWLENELDQAQESLIFLVYHHPTFTVTKKHSWKEKEAFQLKIRSILKNKGTKISAILLGHDHISSFVDFGNVAAVIAGGGREVREADYVSYKESDFQIETQYLSPETQHWALLEIAEGSQSAQVRFINVQNQKTVCIGYISHGPIVLDSHCPLKQNY